MGSFYMGKNLLPLKQILLIRFDPILRRLHLQGRQTVTNISPFENMVEKDGCVPIHHNNILRNKLVKFYHL